MLLHVPRNVLQEDSIHYLSSYQSEAEWPMVAEIIILGSFQDEFDICLSLETSPSLHDLFCHLCKDSICSQHPWLQRIRSNKHA